MPQDLEGPILVPRVFRSPEVYFRSINLNHETLDNVDTSTAHDNYVRSDTGDVITLADDAGASKLEIKNLSGTVVAFIDSLGNLYIKGRMMQI